MPNAISTLGLIGFAALNSLARGGSAISNEAETVRQTASAVVDHVERSQVLFGGKVAAISEIWALANECNEINWNGENASPIDQQAVFNATAFIRALPDGVPLPEFTPEPDGSISLDWIRSRNRLFSLSAGTSNRLAYAWLDGTDKGHAVARFDGEKVPARILDGIRGIISNGNAAIGSR